MRKRLLMFAPLIVVAGMWGWHVRCEPSGELGAVEALGAYFAENSDSSRAVAREWDQWRTFHRILHEILNEVQHGLPLSEAVTKALAAAEEWYPRYLVGLNSFEEGQSLHERIARNVLRHFRLQHAEDRPELVPLIEDLEQQLEQMNAHGTT